MKKAILLACVTGSLSTAVIADEYPDFEAYIGAAGYTFDNDRGMDDAISLEGGLELPLNETMSLEAWLSDYDVDVKNSSAELDAMRINAGALFHLNNGSTRPFISAGFSHLEFENSANVDNSESLVNLGVGVKHYFDSNVVLRGEVLGMNSIDNEWTDFAARLSIGYAFGRDVSSAVVEDEPEQAEVVEEVVEELVEAKPEPMPVVEAVKPVAVVPAPAPVDSDNDGIVDSEDKCANTDAAFKVDATGCPVMLSETVSIQMDVKFPSNSSVLSAEYDAELKKVADFMQQFDQTIVTVEGHSDDRGRDAYNKAISQRRADAVRDALISKFNLPADRVKAMGYGEESPIADNATAEGRATNRRVVAVVKSKVEKAVTK
jgi:OOP family OmpA-OmpF porin